MQLLTLLRTKPLSRHSSQLTFKESIMTNPAPVFKPKTAPTAPAKAPVRGGRGEREKAVAFANVDLVDTNGGKHRVGGVAIELGKETHAMIMREFEASGMTPEEFSAALTFAVSFNPVVSKENVQLFARTVPAAPTFTAQP